MWGQGINNKAMGRSWREEGSGGRIRGGKGVREGCN